MLSNCQKFKENIMLRAYSSELSDLVLLFKNVASEYLSLSRSWLEQTCEHWDSSGLSCTIMAKQSKDLPIEHGHVNIIYCY
jgi:hypothetical protein